MCAINATNMKVNKQDNDGSKISSSIAVVVTCCAQTVYRIHFIHTI